MPTPKDDRAEPAQVADEHTLLEGFLDFHRQTLLWKCAELTDDQLRERPVPPSQLSLHGLVRHLADVERSWFRQRFAGQDLPDLFYTEDNPDGDFLDTAGRGPGRRHRDLPGRGGGRQGSGAGPVAGRHLHRRRGGTYSLRWIYLHMIEEYARHNGHADLIRERIDGATGE